MSERDPLVGKTFQGRYTLLRLLAQGGMGAVYQAVQPGEPREVAIKVLHPNTADDPTMLARFQREAEATMRIQHPNAVRVYGQGMEGDVAFLVMELVKGQSLKAYVTEQGRVPEGRAVDILVAVCDALAATHEAGVIHRDLKPENIMLATDPTAPGGERIKLLDFGLAKPLDDQPGKGLTALGSVVGTPAYMAPEQIGGRAVGPSTDVYAAGVLLFELLTGEAPFDAPDPMRVCWLHLHGEIPKPSAKVPDLNPGLERAILKALSKQQADRQQSAAELRDELRAALATIPAPVRAGAPGTIKVRVMADADEGVETLPVSTQPAPIAAPRAVVIVPPSAPVAAPAPIAAVAAPAPTSAPVASLAPIASVAPARSTFSRVIRSPAFSIAAGIMLAFGLAALALPLLMH